MASRFAMTTRVEWTLYHVADGKATPLASTEVARSVDGRGEVDQQRIACLLHSRSHEGKLSYRLESVGAYRSSESGWTAPQEPPPAEMRRLISDPVADLAPQNERIVFVEGAPVPPDVSDMTIERFSAYTHNHCVVVTVRWWDVVTHQIAAPNPPLERTGRERNSIVREPVVRLANDRPDVMLRRLCRARYRLSASSAATAPAQIS